MRAADVLPNPRNWRTHSEDQRAAFRAILDKIAWESYSRATFEAHAALYQPRTGNREPSKLRFLQYVTRDSRAWWAARQDRGAILL